MNPDPRKYMFMFIILLMLAVIFSIGPRAAVITEGEGVQKDLIALYKEPKSGSILLLFKQKCNWDDRLSTATVISNSFNPIDICYVIADGKVWLLVQFAKPLPLPQQLFYVVETGSLRI